MWRWSPQCAIPSAVSCLFFMDGPNVTLLLCRFAVWWHHIFSPIMLSPFKPASFLGKATMATYRRSALDTFNCVVFYVLSISALVSAQTIDKHTLFPILCVMLALSLRDRVFFFCCRFEVYGYMLVSITLARDDHQARLACQVVQTAIWMGAGISKLGPWFEFVLPIMISCSPMAQILPKPLRKLWFKDYPIDLCPSTLVKLLAHFGTAAEIAFPLLLMTGGQTTLLGMLFALGFHSFILIQIPMGAPLEWNLFSMQSALVLFGSLSMFQAPALAEFSVGEIPTLAASCPGWSIWSVQQLPLVTQLFLFSCCFLVPVIGNFFPRLVSFLLSFRYYAGNWAFTTWVVKLDAIHKLDQLHPICASRFTHQQLSIIFDDNMIHHFEYRALLGRMMHLTGRVLEKAIPIACGGKKNVDKYMIIEGELFAGVVLGYNFGEGFLSGLALADAIAPYCKFKQGELMHVEVDSIPLFSNTLEWRVTDAVTGTITHNGNTRVDDLVNSQPWTVNCN
mmetsp:Transcript_13977/g.24730  ORF Transcript_13977/g.24730 Transcript_13977/m.24730 type:complete len:507 (+) Transcript_13977:418-1938(+)